MSNRPNIPEDKAREIITVLIEDLDIPFNCPPVKARDHQLWAFLTEEGSDSKPWTNNEFRIHGLTDWGTKLWVVGGRCYVNCYREHLEAIEGAEALLQTVNDKISAILKGGDTEGV